MRFKFFNLLLICFSNNLFAASITADLSAVKSGPISTSKSDSALQISWTDAVDRHWQAAFSLDSSKPLITAISVNGATIVERASPTYRCATGRRSGGWDAFFDFPPANPDGTRRFLQQFHPTTVKVRTVGDRLEVSFNGMQLGIFEGSLRYIFYPASSLIQQVAVLSTNERDTAYYYDAGLQMTADQDRRPGGTMNSTIVWPARSSDRRAGGRLWLAS